MYATWRSEGKMFKIASWPKSFFVKPFDPNLYRRGGGGGELPPRRQFFATAQKRLALDLLKLCDFYCQPITHHLVYFWSPGTQAVAMVT